MRVSLAVTLAFPFLAWGVAFAGPAQQERPAFRVTTRLVEVTVIAVDKAGKPVVDLTQGEFRVFDNGRQQKIALFRFEGAPGIPAAKPRDLPPFEFANRSDTDTSSERNITAVVLDSVNTEAEDQMMVKAQTTRMLQVLAPESRVAIYHMGKELRVIHDFTDDMDSLRARLEAFTLEAQTQNLNDVELAARQADELLSQIEARKTPYAGPVFAAVQDASATEIAGALNLNSTVQANRAEATVSALEAIGRHLSGIPGRKSVVWISGGLSMLSPRLTTNPNGIPANPMAGDNLAQVVRASSERLAQYGVALYAIDARGLTSSAEALSERQDMPLLPGRFSELERAAALNADSRAVFALMTSITGGRFIRGTNDMSEGVRLVSGDVHGAYSLGFYPDSRPDGKWHTLKVEVRRPNVRLLHKEGYKLLDEVFQPQSWNSEAEQRAMTNPVGSSAIGLHARCAPTSGDDDGPLLLTLRIDADDLSWKQEEGRSVGAADVYVGERAPDGKVRFQVSRIQAKLLPKQMETARLKGLPFRRQWKPGADTLSIRVLVRDVTTNRTGTVDIPVSRLSQR